MTPKKAVEILREHQLWRRGEGKYDYEGTPVPMPHSTKELGAAIDEAIGALEHLADFEKFHKEMTK